MNKLSGIFSRATAYIILVILLIINILNMFTHSYTFWLSIVSIVMIVLATYMMAHKMKELSIKIQLATSMIEMSEFILHVDTKEELYNKILKEILDNVSGADKGSLITTDDQGGVYFEATIGFDLEAAQKMNMRLEDTFLYKAIDNHIPKSIVVNDIAQKNQSVLAKNKLELMDEVGINDIKSTVCVPITLDKKLFGMINIDSTTESSFKREEIELIEYFSSEISKIIRVYELFEKTVILSKVDALTGLYNRRAFVERVEESLKTSMSIVYFDLDDLKKINDTYGHDAGDMYINHFVKGIKKQLFAKEIFSRFGGDEFVLLYIRSNVNFESFCNQSNKWFLENPIILGGESLVVNFSIGEAVFGIDGNTVEELIKIADHRMYDNKRIKKSN